MDENIKAKVGGYLTLLKEIKGMVEDEATAVRLLSEVAKDVRMEQVRQERVNRKSRPATDKQIGWLRSRGVSVPRGLTVSQASAMIDEEMAREDADARQRPSRAAYGDRDEVPRGVTRVVSRGPSYPMRIP